jgi:hypothetical protein
MTFDFRSNWLELDEKESRLQQDFFHEFGRDKSDVKLKNFKDLGPTHFSIVAFHNRFLRQIQTSFVMEAYYPALTAACALGERVLNHLLISLRDDFRGSPQFKEVYRKDSFDDWTKAIDVLESWEVLLPEAVNQYRELYRLRVQAIHFRPDLDLDAREPALKAIKTLKAIIDSQFSGFGTQPWFITQVPGEIYIKNDWVSNPFVRRIYLPNCCLVGPNHRVVSAFPLRIEDEEYDDRDISDDEFCALRLRVRLT